MLIQYDAATLSDISLFAQCFSVQFACVDGSRCPPLVNNRNGVCDGVLDCRDRSDEARCGLGECTRSSYE